MRNLLQQVTHPKSKEKNCKRWSIPNCKDKA